MTSILGITVVGLALVGIGAWRGVRRLLALPIGMFAGAIAAPRLGPMLSDGLIALTGRDTWAGEAASWAAAYVLVALPVTTMTARLFRQPVATTTAEAKPTHRFHLSGAIVGAVAGGILAWSMLGNLPELMLKTLPEKQIETVVDLRRPFEIMRACRTLCSLSTAEAEQLAARPDVQAVLDNASMEKLLRTPGMIRKVSLAADGDWGALGALATDESVKAAMHEPAFLERVRAVDIMVLVADVERRRASGTSETPTSDPGMSLPAFARDAEFHAQLEREVGSEDNRTQVTRASTPDRPLDSAVYWKNVGTAIEWYDRPTSAAAWVPRLLKPMLPSTTPQTAATPLVETAK